GPRRATWIEISTNWLAIIASDAANCCHLRSPIKERTMPAQTHLFRCLQDNFGVLVHDPATGATAAIDAPEAAPVEAALKATGWRLSDILVTHHHADHTGGIAELKKRHGCRVTAPRNEAARIPAVDATVG